MSVKSEEISDLRSEVQAKNSRIENQDAQILNLNTQVQSLNSQLGQTRGQLEETSRLLDIAADYEDRVEQGIHLSKAYILLADYDRTIDIVQDIAKTGIPQNDADVRDRAKDIYYWLGNNYQYCSDKGFCVGESYCTQIQFFSPDEVVYYGSQDVLCGDCDDQAQLFVGMLYASGVSHNKARVECGSVPSGRHCWGAVDVGGSWYRIDPVCSSPSVYVSFFDWHISMTAFPSSYRDVDCFDFYETSE